MGAPHRCHPPESRDYCLMRVVGGRWTGRRELCVGGGEVGAEMAVTLRKLQFNIASSWHNCFGIKELHIFLLLFNIQNGKGKAFRTSRWTQAPDSPQNQQMGQ